MPMKSILKNMITTRGWSFWATLSLELVISDYIFKNYPHMPEGELTKLRAGTVCEGSLAERAGT